MGGLTRERVELSLEEGRRREDSNYRRSFRAKRCARSFLASRNGRSMNFGPLPCGENVITLPCHVGGSWAEGCSWTVSA